MITVPTTKIKKARIIEINIALVKSFSGCFNCLMWAALVSIPVYEKNTPAAKANVLIPFHLGINPLGVIGITGWCPWATHTIAKITITAKGIRLPIITPYLAMLEKALTPLVAK